MKKELQCLLIISLLLMSLVTVPAFQGNYVKADSENVFITVDSSNFPSEVVLRISLNVSETLTARDFEVYENGVRQQITDVYYTGEGLIMPIDVVFIIDRSDSMDSYIEAVKDSAYQFSRDLEKIGGDNVRFALVTFADYDDARIDLPLTNNVSKFVEALDSIYTAGGTEWSFGGILKALDLKFNPNAQKVFIVVTDEDDQSPYSVEEVAGNLTAEGVLLALVYNHGNGQKLSALSEMVGALDIDISEVQQNGFEEVLHYITTTIGQQYQVVYTPTNQSMDGGERLVRVVVHLPNGDSLEANASYIAEERPREVYEEVMPTDEEIYGILTKIDQWFDEAEEYSENSNLSMVINELLSLYIDDYRSSKEYLPPLIPDISKVTNLKYYEFAKNVPQSSLSKDEAKTLIEFLFSMTQKEMMIGDIVIKKTSDSTYIIEYPYRTIYVAKIEKLGIGYLELSSKNVLPPVTVNIEGNSVSISDVRLVSYLNINLITHDVQGYVGISEGDPIISGKNVEMSIETPFDLNFYGGGYISPNIPEPFDEVLNVHFVDVQLKWKPFRNGLSTLVQESSGKLQDKWILRVQSTVKVGGEIGNGFGAEGKITIGAKTSPENLQDFAGLFPLWGGLMANTIARLGISTDVPLWVLRPVIWAAYVKLIQMYPEEARKNMFLFTEIEVGGTKKVIPGVASWGSYFHWRYEQNLLPRTDPNHVTNILYSTKLKASLDPGTVLPPLGGIIKVSPYGGINVPLIGIALHDPPVYNGTSSYMSSELIWDIPTDLDSDGLFDVLSLKYNITTNTPGTYYAIPTLLVNNSVVSAQGFNIALRNGSNVITFNIPGQYVYNTHHNGSFEVGLVINDVNGTLVYSNFTLGNTKPYDYNDFAHVVPAFDIEYSPVDLDSDGLYDKLVVNITEKTGLKGITLAPALTAPGWIVYLNSTNLTSTTTYTLSIDGMHVRKFMGNFSLILYVANMTSGVYLGSYNWSINVDPMKFESAYPTIIDVIPRTINYKPAVTFTVNVSRDSNISIILKYDVGGLVYGTWGYFENVTPGIQNFTVFLDPSAFVLNGTRKATLLSATLIANDLTTDSIKINKEVSFLLLSRADVLNIDQKLNAVKKLLNMTIDLISYEDVNSTVVVVLSSGNATLTTLVCPEIHEGTILELPVTFNLSGILSNISENGTLSVILYDENGELLKMKTVNVDLSPLFTPGHLKVYSNPSGASVYIDSVYFGVTPLEVDLLPGEYTLELSKEGYQKLIVPVTINSGESKTVYATLSPSPIPATLEISSFPSGARVYIDNELKGLTPLTVEVSPGTHTVKLTREGYHDYVTTITIDQGETVTINVRLTPSVNYAPFSIGDYSIVVDNASSVFFVFNNYGTPDAFSVSQYVSRTLPIDKRAVSRLAREFDFNEVSPNDLIISVGGPLVNNVTARYDNASAVHMSIGGGSITIVTPQGNITWTVPRPWWNVTEGYFIIQAFYDSEFNVTVFTIYGTDADSTAAGAYYFLTEVYPNIADYSGITYIVGKWEDTEPGADIPLPGARQGDTSGFSAGDSITIVAQG